MGKLLLSIALVALIAIPTVSILSNEDNENVDTDLNIVTSLEDEISDNTAWCGTFNLIWNDLKNELVKDDVKFVAGQTESVDNLNKGTFTTNELSEDSYYKVLAHPTLALKDEIKKAIKDKFNETSSIIDDFDFENASEEDYFLYAMLKKEFEFPKVFTKLKNGTFGKYNNVKYFGIDSSTDETVRDQIDVLYYNSEDDFAIKINTKQNDEVIVSRGNDENNFLDIYNNINAKAENYTGGHSMKKVDTFKMPNISFNLKKEISDVENKEFLLADNTSYVISKALQTIEFDLDEKGGRIKSEAGMMMNATSIAEPPVPRNFIVDDTFTIFLREEGRDLPYFAAKISDISQVQEIN